MKNTTQALKVITLALILSFGISYVYAWTAPTVTPPGGNVSAPINTSATAQYKEGAIGIGGLIRGYANAVFDGSVGIGTTAPGAKLEVVGDVISKGTSWTSRTSSVDNSWLSVTYGNGLFVAVANTGTGNRVMTSPDGINWTTRTSSVDNSWRYVTYGNGLFVAVATSGTGNRVMTSPDGITWTTRTSAADNSWNSVTYGNGLFVAVSSTGLNNRVMTSPDGITWTIRTSAANNSWYSVTYGKNLFVAVAYDGLSNRVMTSPDGITWTIRTSAADNWWYSVTYGNGLFVAVAGSGTGNRVMTSPDGITWTSRTSAANNSWYSVIYGNGLFVAVTNAGTGNRVMTSPDGITWTSRTSAADNSWLSVTYGNGLFVAVSNSGIGNRVMTSGKQDDQVVSHNNTYQGGMNIYGNVGIGTKSPTQPLDVVGNIKGTGVCIGTDCKTAWPVAGVNPPAGSSFLDTSATAQTKSGDLTVNKITSTTSCIGTDCKTAWPTGGATPPAGSEFLDTSSTAQTKAGNIVANIITSGGSGGVGEGDFISKAATIYNGTIGGKISFFNTDNVTNTAAIAEIRTVNVSNNTPPTIQSHNSGGKLSFATKGVFSTLDERMIIGADGKVGIGVPVPAQLLDVGGIIKATGLQVTTGAAAGKVLTSDASGNAAWQDISSSGAAQLPRESFYNNPAFNGTAAYDFTVPAGVTEVLVEAFGAAGGGGSYYIGTGSTGGTSSFGTISATGGTGGGPTPDAEFTYGVNGTPGTGIGGFINSRLFSFDSFGLASVTRGGLGMGGLGGRGGYSKGIASVTPGATYSVIVGAGGAGACYSGWYCGYAGGNGFVRLSYLGDLTLTLAQKCANAGGTAVDASNRCTIVYGSSAGSGGTLMSLMGFGRELDPSYVSYVCAWKEPTYTYLSNTTETHGISCGGGYGLTYWTGSAFTWADYWVCNNPVTVVNSVTCQVPVN